MSTNTERRTPPEKKRIAPTEKRGRCKHLLTTWTPPEPFIVCVKCGARLAKGSKWSPPIRVLQGGRA